MTIPQTSPSPDERGEGTGQAGLLKSEFELLRRHVERQILGQSELVERLLTALLANGHLLVEGAPGLAKTKAVKALASGLESDFHRIQFTPDLLPADLTGTEIYRPQDGSFRFDKGPVFHNLLLADEVNRAPAKVQSALLEAMGERQVTVGRETYRLPELFLVMATQNPIEQEGTYPLPEAQLDRFLMKVFVRHPTQDIENQILNNYSRGFNPNDLVAAGLEVVTSADEIMAMRQGLLEIRVGEEIIRYITEIVGRTRNHRAVYLGASPRASISLLTASRAMAARNERDFVVPDDVKALAPSVLRHRLVLHPDAEIEGVSADECVDDILMNVAVPHTAA
jgi:MoxR-like ATPase